MELIIEQLTPTNKTLQFFKASGETIRIGRAYDNDIILQEEHISPYHAELSVNSEGDLVLNDLDSINGIKDATNKAVKPNTHVTSGDKFVFGKLTLRIMEASHKVIEAKKLNFLEEFTSKINHWYWAVAFTSLMYLHYILQAYISSIAKIVWPTLILNNIYVILSFIVIALIISVLARIFKKDVKLFAIVTLIMCLALIQEYSAIVGNFLWFNWGESNLLGIGNELIEAGLIFAFLWGSFYLASNMNFRRISITSSVLLLSILVLSNLSYFDEDDVYLYPSYSAIVLPSKWLLIDPISVEENVSASKSLFEQSAKEAKRRNIEAEEEKLPLM